MRKADYATLATIIRTELALDKQYISEDCNRAKRNTLRYVARQFAERASANRAEFLKACGINP